MIASVFKLACKALSTESRHFNKLVRINDVYLARGEHPR